MKKTTRRCLVLSTLLGLTVPVAAPSFGAAATPRALAANEVLAVTDVTGIKQSAVPVPLSHQKIEWSSAAVVSPANGAKLEAAIKTLACAGKPKLTCTMTVDGKIQKVPASQTSETLEAAGSGQVEGIIKIKLKRPPIIIIIGKPLTA